jgi:RNA polymerase sigma factor (sigma-70 family)
MINTHSVYGRVQVEGKMSDHNGGDFVNVALMNRRDGLPERITVGKVALSDRGDYVDKGRKTSLIQDYMPLAYSAASQMYSEGSEWEELLQVAALGLCEAASRHKSDRNNGFAAFAKPYIMGYIKNHQNPERNGNMNTVNNFVPDGEDKISTTPEENDAKLRLYGAIEMLTEKQRFVVEMVSLKGHTEEEVASMLGIAQKNVHVLLDRATVALRKHLGPKGK